MNQYNIPAIADRICHLRKQKGLSLEEASEMLGIQRRSLSHIEAGVKGCSIDLLVRFADIFDCSLDYLVLGRDVDGAVARDVLQRAVELNWIPENPAERVDPCAEDSEILFTTFLVEWLNMMKTAVKVTTYSGYEKNVKGKIIPYFDQYHQQIFIPIWMKIQKSTLPMQYCPSCPNEKENPKRR